VLAVSIIALMIEAASTSETSVNFYQTMRRNNPEEDIFIFAAVRTSNLTKLCMFPAIYRNYFVHCPSPVANIIGPIHFGGLITQVE
jgi:hypothetical protein